ncbi:hypothetical protein SLEP1_g56657 [Rubroshorea leprosula]|uniref:Uncharacterized protein n=1 Tax=Rubroshorea leprosula TaxID=152421 RepID=A0AAV5MJ48_9ROSI|nr:hypothetical protein SLEP1_g56657 [Rubroshorea leprosula]
MDSPMNSGKLIYLLRKYHQSCQSQHWALTLQEMGCRKRTGCLLLLFTAMHGYYQWPSILVLGLVLIKPTGIHFPSLVALSWSRIFFCLYDMQEICCIFYMQYILL